MNPAEHIVTAATPDAVAENAATLFSSTAADAISQRGRFTVALSGGSTPRRLYQLLATPQWRTRIDWAHVHLFWGDERHVPIDHPDSNYRMTREALLSKIDIPESNVHRIPTELSSAEADAAQYERTLRDFFASDTPPGALPQFDLVLLGLGTNGHTASLFPYCAAVHEADRLVTADFVAEVNAWRITMTAPVLNNALFVAFLVAGADKADVLNEILYGPYDPDRLPAQLIQPGKGFLTWFIDQPASAKLPK